MIFCYCFMLNIHCVRGILITILKGTSMHKNNCPTSPYQFPKHIPLILYTVCAMMQSFKCMLLFLPQFQTLDCNAFVSTILYCLDAIINLLSGAFEYYGRVCLHSDSAVSTVQSSSEDKTRQTTGTTLDFQSLGTDEILDLHYDLSVYAI